MSGRLDGKVALITGAARGQGRSHAIRMAEEGADIIAVDICADIESNNYPLATPEDLQATVKAVEAVDQRIVARIVDVRQREQLVAAVAAGIAEFGHLDVVVANAGILPLALGDPDPMDFVDVVDVDLVGVLNTVAVAIPHLPDGASIVVTASNAALLPNMLSNPVMGPGVNGYGWSKRVLITYVEQIALHLSPRCIRANVIHPTNCNTDMIQNQGMYDLHRPDLKNPSREEAIPAFTSTHAMPIPFVEPIDISHLVVYLTSDESRYVTGQQIQVDAGAMLKYAGSHS